MDFGLSLSFDRLFFYSQILFLGPLMQLSMDCPCDLADGLKVVLGESLGLREKVGTGSPAQWSKRISGLMVRLRFEMYELLFVSLSVRWEHVADSL